jgi:hypothetical protein
MNAEQLMEVLRKGRQPDDTTEGIITRVTDAQVDFGS